VTYDRTTPIRGKTSITADQAIAYATSKGALGGYRAYLRFIWARAPKLGLNPLAVMGQWCDETATGTSPRWQRGDPAGIGIFSDATASTLSDQLTGEQSAAIHLVELATKLDRSVPSPDRVGGIDVAAIDPHLQRVLQFVGRADWPEITTLHDLRIPLAGGDFTWAQNQAYGDQIADHMNAIAAFAKEAPMPDPAITFGRVPHHAFLDRPIAKDEGAGQNNLGRRTVKGVSWHRMLGTLWGTDDFFRQPSTKALTDYGVGVAATDGDDHDGEVLRWNDPLGVQSGWASGTYSSAAYGDGAAFVAKYGIDAINRDRASIEISGNYDTPLSEASRQAIAALTAYWADQAHIPWDVFPIVPADGFSFVCWHNEFGPDFGQKVCPGSVVMQETGALIERTREILRAAQLSAAPRVTHTYAPSELPAWWDESLADLHAEDQHINGTTYWALRRNFTVSTQTTRRSKPEPTSPVSGPKLGVGDTVRGERIVQNGRQWVLTADGHYVLASKLSPAISLKSR
jgi:hypothetical protein